MSARYWRIFFLSGVNNEIDLNEVEFYTAHNTDTSAATGGTAISGENYSGAYLPAAAFNGVKTADGWASGTTNTYGSTKWIGYATAIPGSSRGQSPIAPCSRSRFPHLWSAAEPGAGGCLSAHDG